MNSVGIDAYSECISEKVVGSSVDRWRIVTSDLEFLSAFVEVLTESTPSEKSLELLCGSNVLKELEYDFLLSTKANDLVAGDVLSIRERGDDEEHTPTQLTNPERSVVVVPVGGKEGVTLEFDESAAAERLWEKHQSSWDLGLPYTFDSPPYSRMLAIADNILGSDLRADLDLAYGTVESRGPDERPEPLAIALLVGAKHESLFADVVEWAEKTDLATQSMVSKTKGKLESIGLVGTESESVGVGRPRQRLKLADDQLASSPADELLAHAQTVLD